MIKDFKSLADSLISKKEIKRLVLACAHDEHSLDAVYEAHKEGLIIPVLVGKESEIRNICKEQDYDFGDVSIYNIADDVECARKAVELIRNNEGDFLMKGKMQTSDLLRQVVNKETGLQAGRIMSHVAIFEIPNYHKLIVETDGGMILTPDVEQKTDIIKNAVDCLHNIGYEEPKVAVLCGAEILNPKAPESVDAAELKELYKRGDISGCIVEGPISYDIALSKEIADLKGFDSPVAGDADILVLPNMAAGNILGKAWTITAGGSMAGIIVGAKAPIVLTSRGARAEEKFNSIVFAAASSE